MATHQFTGDKLTKIEIVMGEGKDNVIYEGTNLEDLGLGSYGFVIGDNSGLINTDNGTSEKSLTLAVWASDTTILEFDTKGAGEPYGSNTTTITCTWEPQSIVISTGRRLYQAVVSSIHKR